MRVKAYVTVPVRVPVTIQFDEDDGPERLIIDATAELDWGDNEHDQEILEACDLAVSEADSAMLEQAAADALLPGGRRR